MPSNRIYLHFGRILAAWIAVTGLMASEHHGTVKSGGIPVPGATVTAIQGDKKIATTTDDDGAYSFPDLADGVWTIEVQMLGFAKLSREIGIAPKRPARSGTSKCFRRPTSGQRSILPRRRFRLRPHPRPPPLPPRQPPLLPLRQPTAARQTRLRHRLPVAPPRLRIAVLERRVAPAVPLFGQLPNSGSPAALPAWI